MKTKVEFKRFKNDPQKAVLPTITFIDCSHPKFKDKFEKVINNTSYHHVYLIAIGWWDFAMVIKTAW